MSERMDARVCSARNAQTDWLAADGGKHVLHHALNGALPLLPRPAREAAAVVLDEELRGQVQPRRRATTSRYSLSMRTVPSPAWLNSAIRSRNRRIISS